MGAEPAGTSSKRRSSGSKTSSSTDRQHGRQYYYFYGSTSSGGGPEQDEMNAVRNRRDPTSPPTGNENDSLVGESLVPTDNEEETPKNSEADYQQLLISHPNGGNRGLRPVEEHSRRGRSRRRHFCTRYVSSCCKLFRRQRPAFQALWFIVGVVLVVLLSLACFPNSRFSHSITRTVANPTTAAEQLLRQLQMRFPQVDRGDYDDPVSNFLDSSLFHSSLLNSNTNKNNAEKGTFQFPFPTGAFWTNLVLPPTADRGLSYPVAVYPYAYKWSEKLLQASYPAQHRKENPKAIHDYFFPDLSFGTSEDVTSRKIMSFDPLSVTLRFYAAGRHDSYWETYLVQGSPYITLAFSYTSPVINAISTFTNIICPRERQNSSRRGRNLKFGVCYSNNNTTEQADTQMTTLHGVQFIIETQEGVRWIAFASELIRLQLDTQTRRTIQVTAEDGKAFSGVLRLAILPPTEQQQHGTDGVTTHTSSALDQIESSKGMQRLIYHAGVYPVSGKVSWTFRSSGTDASSIVKNGRNTLTGLSISSSTSSSSSSSSTSKSNSARIGTIQFTYKTKSFTPTSITPNLLLMLALPHHAENLSPSTQLGMDQFDLVFKCIKGPMRPVLGSSWSYDEPLPTLGFDSDSGSSASHAYLDPAVKRTILKSLKEDVQLTLPTATENIYGFGKQAARLAQIAHIANNLLAKNGTSTVQKQLGNTTDSSSVDAELSDVADKAKASLYHALDGALKGKVSDYLVFDANLGGMVTSDGLRNKDADFGNGRYNDHHFHYGYVLYACAVMGKLDPTFVNTHGDYVDAIYYDIAHGANFDSSASTSIFLPGARHKIWFDGHSFASGLFPFGNGKSQESSSEAVNAYYGAYLWSLVRNGAADDPALDDSEQTDFARLLLAMELRGAKTYWHMMPPGAKAKNQTDALTVYSPEFSKNYMVGNLGMLDALCSTWFGTENLYVHMINFIPVTSITGELFGVDYVSPEYANVLKPLGEVEMAWRGYVVSNHAIIDPNSAWLDAQSLFGPTLDSALSKSQVLYWISTRSGFSASVASSASDGDAGDDSGSKGSSAKDGQGAACSDHEGCSLLEGQCCPSGNGIFLDCCS